MSSTTPIVLVTGGSGFVGGVLVDALVQRGYRVRTTVRSLQDSVKVGHLKRDFPTVELFEADLTKDGSFQAAIDGCEIVFHTASPFQLVGITDAQAQLVDPAVNGTANVVGTALATPSVRRIVLTSSVAACRRPDKEFGYVLTDKDWNTSANIATTPYPLSKVLAEKKAWELVEAYQATEAHKTRPVTLVTVCPSLVIGPPHGTRTDGVSVGTMLKVLDGTFAKNGGLPRSTLPVIDVRDVARAHIEAAERPEASGRYIASSARCYPNKVVAETFTRLFPQLASQIPTDYVPEGTLPPEIFLDPSRTEKELGFTFIPLEQSLKDMGEKLIELGLVKVPSA